MHANASSRVSGKGWAPRGVVLAAALLAGPAAAGPCPACDPSGATRVGWWDDRPLAPGEFDDHAPRIDVDGDGLTSRVAIAWERRSAGSGVVWIGTSDDGGCSFDVRAVAAGGGDDRSPDVAVSLSRDAVALAFIRDGAVVATVSLDGGRTFAPPENVDPPAGTDAATRPRLAMIPVGGELHLHVAWAEGGRLRLARSLLSGAAGSWNSGPALSERFTGYSGWADVEIAADTRSRSVGADSGVTLVATGLQPGSSAPEIFALRSNDSGATFLGDPQDPPTLDVPRRVSEPRPLDEPLAGALEPALDVSDDGSGEFYTWEAVLYTDLASPVAGCRADARAEEGGGPSTIADWNDGAAVDLLVSEPARAAAFAVIPNPLSRPPSPEAHAFVEVDASGPGTPVREVASSRAMLDTNSPGWVAPTCPQYRLSGVDPPRAAGEIVARSVTADEDLSHVFAAWADTRDGASAIWWKRTDTVVEPALSVSAGPGACANGGGLLVSWQLPAAPPNCDIDHVRVEHGRVAGTYDGSVDVGPTSTSVAIPGLVEGVAYFARVTIVDEACNEAASTEASGRSATCVPVACPQAVGGTLRAAKLPTPDDIELSWEPPATDATHDAATSYDVFRSTTRARDGFALLRNEPAPLSRDLGACLPASPLRHYYLIVARNACGTSGDEPLP